MIKIAYGYSSKNRYMVFFLKNQQKFSNRVFYELIKCFMLNSAEVIYSKSTFHQSITEPHTSEYEPAFWPRHSL